MEDEDHPLGLAAREGDLDTVKMLIRDGADINGGDVTCLMEACRNGHEEMVSYLIESGADINKRDSLGTSALHNCVGCMKQFNCMKLLVDNGAEIHVWDDDRMTPLLLACYYNRMAMVEYILKSPVCTREAKIETLEYMGAMRVKEDDFQSACGYWLRSLEERLLAEPCDLVQSKSIAKHLAFDNLFHTAQDLDRIASSAEEMWVQALITMDRIKGHFLTYDYVDLARAACNYLQATNYRRCIMMLMHMLNRQTQSCGVLSEWLRLPLSILTGIISSLPSKEPPGPYEVVMPLLIEGVRLTELAMQPNIADQSQDRITNLDYILTFVFCSMSFLAKRQPEMTEEDSFKIHQIIEEFVHMYPCDDRDRRVLHLWIEYVDQSHHPCEIAKLLNVGDYDNTPLHVGCRIHDDPDSNIEMIKLLLAAGADPGAVNDNGQTPLHVASIHAQQTFPLTEVVQLLLGGGANPLAIDGHGDTAMHLTARHNHPAKHNVIKLMLSNCCSCAFDMCNTDGKLFTDYLYSEMVRDIEKSFDFCSLQCLSAKALLTYSIPYESVLPTKLATFVNFHSTVIK